MYAISVQNLNFVFSVRKEGMNFILLTEKNPYPPHETPLEISKGKGFLKVKILKAKYEL